MQSRLLAICAGLQEVVLMVLPFLCQLLVNDERQLVPCQGCNMRDCKVALNVSKGFPEEGTQGKLRSLAQPEQVLL